MTTKIRIAHVISSLQIGGAETFLCELIEGMGSSQYEHHVIYFHAGPLVDRLKNAGIPVYQVKGFVSLYDPVFIWRLGHLLVRLKPSLIHSLLWSANFFGRLLGWVLRIPCVCALHGEVFVQGNFKTKLDRFTMRFAQHVIAVSAGVATSFKEHGVRIEPARLTVVKNGIAWQKVQARALEQPITREMLGLSSSHVVIGSVGRFCAVKNYSFLIATFAKIYEQNPSTRLLLVGYGPDELALRSQVKELGLESVVIFVIGQPAYAYYSVMDIFVSTSLREGISLALLEAMSLGCVPVVASHTEHHEVIRHAHNGMIFSLANPDECPTILHKLIGDEELRVNMRKNAQESIKSKFTLDRAIDAYRNIFECAKNC